MTCSPYLEHVRDLADIRRIVDDYERAHGVRPRVDHVEPTRVPFKTIKAPSAFANTNSVINAKPHSVLRGSARAVAG